MRILAFEREKPGITPDQYKGHSEDEARRVWELIQEEVIREIYFQSDEDSAVIMLECKDIQEARQILNTLPLVKAGLIDFELIPLRAYPGLARLFKE